MVVAQTMAASFKSIHALDTFGASAAEEDPVLTYFLATEAVQKIRSGKTLLVLGRKGSGKTALVRHFSEANPSTASTAPSFRSYPWSVHASRIDAGASQTEAYVASWRYLIAVQAATTLLATAAKSDPNAKRLNQFLVDNYGHSPTSSEILRPAKLKLTKLSFEPQVLGNKLGGVALDRSGPDKMFGPELDAITTSILNATAELARASARGSVELHFDELDQGLSKVDAQRNSMLIGLILAARSFYRGGAISGALKIHPVIYLRTDLWAELEFSDKNKVTQNQCLTLEWSSEDLMKLVDKRLERKLGKGASWSSINDGELIRGSQQKWSHIVARTFQRPRDIIQFLNTALSVAKKRSDRPLVFSNKDITEARDPYSRYLKEELDDEIVPHWSEWGDALKAFSTISTITFTRDEFDRVYAGCRSANNAVSADAALEAMYRFSIIGYETRSGYGGSGWTFHYTEPTAGWDSTASRFKVHPGLKEYARLKEERASQE